MHRLMGLPTKMSVWQAYETDGDERLSQGYLWPGPPDIQAVSALLIEAGTVCFAGWLLPNPNGCAGHGSGRLGVVAVGVVADGGHRFPLAEPGPGGERLAEPVVS
jgi:hypothetical protein